MVRPVSRLSRGVEQVVEDEDLLREGNFAGAVARGHADLRPGDAPRLAEIGQDEALLGRVDKVLGAGSVLQALGVEGFQFRHGQGDGRLIIIGAGHAASFMVSGSSRPASRTKSGVFHGRPHPPGAVAFSRSSAFLPTPEVTPA